MLVDYERVVQALKEYVCTKGSHGQRELLAEISRLEAACTLEEGLPEKALRLYGVVLSDALLRPALGDPALDPRDGSDDLPDRRSGTDPSEPSREIGRAHV